MSLRLGSHNTSTENSSKAHRKDYRQNKRLGLKLSKTIVIVTCDFIGPIKNGGIGTACFHLAVYLAKRNKFRVQILFTGHYQYKNEKYWAKYYKDKYDVEFFSPDPLNHDHEIACCLSRYAMSYAVYQCLLSKQDTLHCIIFQDWLADGFYTIKAKYTLNEFIGIKIINNIHSPTQWQYEGMERNVYDIFDFYSLCYAEKYCAERSDIVIAPSRHMFDWMEKNNWRSSGIQKIIPNLYSKTSPASTYKPDIKHLIFFGRLETRKGLHIFLEAILQVYKKAGTKKISLLGNLSEVKGKSTKDFLKDYLEKMVEIDFTIKTKLDHEQALNYIIKSKGVVFLPSTLDNLPYSVLECLYEGIPVLASRVGGIPEMLDDEFLFEPNAKSLSEFILKLESIRFDKQMPLFDVHESAQEFAEVIESDIRSDNEYQLNDKELVSVCIPYYNTGKYLASLLKSLKNSTYKNIEVIIVNDGSTDDYTNTVFTEQEILYKEFPWKFIRSKNLGISGARNLAVSHAKGKYLVFVDSDNIPKKEMIEVFVQAIQKTQVNVMTCHMKIVTEDTNIDDHIDYKVINEYWPIGFIPYLSWAENTIGDANCIMLKETFDKNGGFVDDKKTSYEDWDLFLKLGFNNASIEVIPKALFWYRYAKDGFSRVSNHKLNMKRVSTNYTKENFFNADFYSDVLYPFYRSNLSVRNELYSIQKSRSFKLRIYILHLWAILPKIIRRTISKNRKQ